MRLRFKACFILLSLLVILPAFLLSPQPAFAFASHIVRLKYEDDSPVREADVFLAVGEYSDICGGDYSSCEHDCSHLYNLCCGPMKCPRWTGVTWRTSTDSHGIATFLARNGASTGRDATIQVCSTHNNNPLIMAVPYLSSSGHWRLDNISGYSSAAVKDDSQSSYDLYLSIVNDVECCPGRYKCCETGSRGLCPGCTEENSFYRGCGWREVGFNYRANVAKVNTSESGGPVGIGFPGNSGKPFNIYWEWTWVGPPTAQGPNPEKQTVLGFVNNLFAPLQAFFKNLFRS